MGVVNFESEHTSSVAASRIFKAILDDTLIPKVVPQAFESVEIIQGDGGVGSIKLMTFPPGSPYKSIKHQIEKIDNEKFIYGYSLIEGDVLEGKFEKISYESAFVPTPEGGSVCKNSSTYYTVGDFELTEEHIKVSKERSLGLFKVIEAYLVANPDAYA